MRSQSSSVNSTTLGSVEPTTPVRSRSVLIVQDDPLAQVHLETLLEVAGYSVACVDSVARASKAVATVFFPIVILDRGLADGDGLTLCSQLREGERPSRVFVLVLSARDSQQAVGQDPRADAHSSKRTSDADLLAYLDAASTVARFATMIKASGNRP